MQDVRTTNDATFTIADMLNPKQTQNHHDSLSTSLELGAPCSALYLRATALYSPPTNHTLGVCKLPRSFTNTGANLLTFYDSPWGLCPAGYRSSHSASQVWGNKANVNQVD